MTITIIGYYGCNFGDDLMLQGLITKYDNKNCNLIVLSYADLNLNDITYNKCRLSSYNIKNISLKEKIKIFHISEYVIWGGGSCFNDVNGTGAIKQMLLAKFVNPHIKVIYSAIGIDIKSNKLHKLYLHLAILIAHEFSVRDKMSLETVKKYKKVFLCKDLIYINTPLLASIIPCQLDNYLLISYRNINEYFPKNSKIYLKYFISYIIRLAYKNKIRNIVVFNCDIIEDSDDNLTIFKNLKKDMPNTNIIYNDTTDTKEICSLIKGADMVITGRLHAAVIANYYNKRFQLLNYSKKNEAFVAEAKKNHSLLEYEDLANFYNE